MLGPRTSIELAVAINRLIDRALWNGVTQDEVTRILRGASFGRLTSGNAAVSRTSIKDAA